MVLERLRDTSLQVDITKYEFNLTEVYYLDLIVTTNSIRIDPKKLETIRSQETLENVKDVQSFLGFTNFYRRFIAKFSAIASLLTALTKKEKTFIQTLEAKAAFQKLKATFLEGPILAHFDPDLEIVVETDASNHVRASILS